MNQVTDDEAEELDEQTVVRMLEVTDTRVRCMTHCALTKSDVNSVIKKLKFVINEYDSMVFLEYKIHVDNWERTGCRYGDEDSGVVFSTGHPAGP